VFSRLFAVVFRRLMMSNRAPDRRAYKAMMTRVVAGDSAHDGSLKTAFRIRGIRRGDHAKRHGGANVEDFHAKPHSGYSNRGRRDLRSLSNLALVIAGGSLINLGKHGHSNPGVFPVQRLRGDRLKRLPFERNGSNDKKSLKIKMLEQALIEKVYQLFR
jgi:hypothetical protein